MKQLILLLFILGNGLVLAQDEVTTKDPQFFGAVITQTYKGEVFSRMGLVCKVYGYNDKSKCDIYDAFEADNHGWKNIGRVTAKDQDSVIEHAHKLNVKYFNQEMSRAYYGLTYDTASFCGLGLGILCPAVPFVAIGQIVAAPFVGLFHLLGLSTKPFQKRKIRKTFEFMTNSQLARREINVRRNYFTQISNSIQAFELD